MAEVRQVGDLPGGNLEMILTQTQQQINAFDIKSGREKADVSRYTVRDEFMVYVLSKFKATQHLMLGFVAVSGLGLVVRLFCAPGNLAVRVKSLKFDKISTSLSGSINEQLGQPEVAIVINASFGDDENSVFHDFYYPKERV
jgi:hypothetical protein